MDSCKEYEAMISRMLDDDLSADELARLHAHLENCENCRRMYDAFQTLRAGLTEDAEEPPETFATDVMEQIRREPVLLAKRRPKIGRYIALAACLAVVAFSAYRFHLFGGMRMGSASNEAPMTAEFSTEADVWYPESVTAEDIGASMTVAPADCDEVTNGASLDEVDSIFSVPASEPDAAMNEARAESELPETLTYAGETYSLSGRVDAVPEEASAAQTQYTCRVDEVLPKAQADEPCVLVVDDTLYMQTQDGDWAVYRK